MRTPWREDAGEPPQVAGERWERWAPHRARSRRLVVLPVLVALVAQLPLGFWMLHVDPARGLPFLAAALVGAGAVAATGRWPGPAVVVAGAASVVGQLLVPTPPAAIVPFLLAVVLACIRGARVWALATVAAAIVLPLAQLLTTDAPLLALRSVGELVLLLAATVVGESVRSGRQRMLDRRAAEADRRRISEEQERVRIARELHDVLAHSLSSISVQANVGLHLADAQPEAAKQALAAIRDVSRTALDEVRQVLGVLRGDAAAPRVPEPDLDALAPLVRDTAALGLDVTLADELRPRPDQPVQLALYRIVQESLTNAARHAPGATVTVRLARDGDAATALIRSAGAAAVPPLVPGRGITGMRERAELLGGRLDVAASGSGVAVAARIPARWPAEVAG
jgi:signal transduction histidine kinase